MDYNILVNENNKIDEEYLKNIIIPSLIPVNFSRDNGEIFSAFKIEDKKIYLEKCAAEAWEELKKYVNGKGIVFDICSGFLSIENQTYKYNDFLARNGLELTTKRMAKPGFSEHHTGLALDCDYFIDEDWAGICSDNNKETKLIHNILHNFGFILRYPKGKEEITGMQYEPWHIRYVGKDLATFLYNYELTLEEHLMQKDESQC